MSSPAGQATSLVDALRAARDSGRAITYLRSGDDHRRVTYAELYVRATGLLGVLQARGLSPQQELIIHLANNEAIVDAFWACQLGRIVPVPVATGTTPSHLHKTLKVFLHIKTACLLTTTVQLERLRTSADQQGLTDEFTTSLARVILLDQVTDTAESQAISMPASGDLALVQFSSGSTGNPKGVCLTQANILANIRASTRRAQFRSGDKFLSWMPLTHDMGMIGFHLLPLVNQLDQVIMPTELFVRRPSLWLEAAAEHKATVLSSPNFGYQHVLSRLRLPDNLDLSHIRLIFNGAEPISAATARKFMQACQPHNLPERAMYPVYGLAEASLAVCFPEPGAAMESLWINAKAIAVGKPVDLASPDTEGAVELVCLGSPLDDTQMTVSDDSGHPVGEGVVGHLLIRGPNVTNQYYQNPQATEELISDAGWVRTGDLGFLKNGKLFVTGRHKDLIIANGQNLFAHDLEDLLVRTIPEIQVGKIAVCAAPFSPAGGDQLLAFVVHRKDASTFLAVSRSVASTLTEYAGLDKPIVVPIHRLPKTTSGKVQRQALAHSFGNGEFDSMLKEIHDTSGAHRSPAEQRAGNEVEAKLLAICNSIMIDEPIGLTDNLFDAGTSSLKLAQIHEKIDDYWPDQLELTDFFDYPTVRDLASYLEGRLVE